MTTVRQLLQTKGSNLWTVSPDASVYDALEIMADKNVGALLVLDQGDLAGILSERDYARKVILKGKSPMTTPVKEIMTTKVYYVQPEHTIDDCMALMTNRQVRHLPVLVDGRLGGMI